jgi:hypothetical protein
MVLRPETHDCPAHLAGDPSALQCTRPADHRDGHTYAGRSVPDRHDRTEPAQDEQA